MNKLVTLLIVIFIIVPVVAQGANWVLIATSTENYKFYLDLDSINKKGNVVKFWIKETKGTENPNTLNYMLTHYQINCQEKMLQVVDALSYSNGKLVFTLSSSPPPKPIPLDTIGEGFYKLLCEQK